MSKWKTLKRVLTDREYRTIRLAKAGFYNYMSDRDYITKQYRVRMGRELNLEDPQLFSEKLQWLKLHDHNPLYTQLVDKYRVRDYIAQKVGAEYLIPLLGVWDDPDEIDFDALPDQFVLKCTHNSGTGMCICRDKSKLDHDRVRENLRKGLRENFYMRCREWPYKDVPRRIIAEKLMTDRAETTELKDYKFFCFNSEVKCFKVDFDRFVDHRANYYDRLGSLLPFGETVCPPKYEEQIQLPSQLPEMIKLAETLSAGFVFLRVDFYCVCDRIYFGELTLYPNGGWGTFTDQKWDYTLGQWLSVSARSS